MVIPVSRIRFRTYVLFVSSRGRFCMERPLLITSFNIQVLDEQDEQIRCCSEVGRDHSSIRFDCHSGGEVEDDVLPTYKLPMLRKEFRFLDRPRLGRTVSRAVCFRLCSDRIEYDPSSIGTISDPDDQLHREPFVTRFRAKTRDTTRAFTFWMVNTHTDLMRFLKSLMH